MNVTISPEGGITFFAELLQDMSVFSLPILTARVNGKVKDKDLTVIFNRTIDYCAFVRSTQSSTVAKKIYQNIEQNGRIPKICPIRKGVYFLNNTLVNNDIFPPYLPEMKVLSRVTYVTGNGKRARVIFGVLELLIEVYDKTKKKLNSNGNHNNKKTDFKIF